MVQTCSSRGNLLSSIMQENLSFNLERGKSSEEGRSLLERKRYANLPDLEPKRHGTRK